MSIPLTGEYHPPMLKVMKQYKWIIFLVLLFFFTIFRSTAIGQTTTNKFSFTILLHGIGNAGDNASPNSGGNKTPRTTTRTLQIQIFNATNQLLTTKSGTVAYNSQAGNFIGTIDMGTLSTGSYIVKVKTDRYLRRTMSGIQNVTAGQTKQLPIVSLIAGDSNGDNLINILDYNILVDCFSDLSPAKNCIDSNKKLLADLSDDGNVNQFDYNLLLREFSVQVGDGGGTTPTNAPIPSPTGTGSGGQSQGNPDPNNTGLGTGTNTNLEVGVNMTAFNKLKADAAAGSYDRPCTAAEHNSKVWHTLVDPIKKCHYDHQHGDDPNYVNDIFGQPGTWFGQTGQSISYPWQTFTIPDGQTKMYVNTNPAQWENNFKHEGYGWVVRRNQNCPIMQPDNTGNPFIRPMGACVTDFRLQYHFHGMMDAATRFHSTSIEMRVCMDKSDPSTCGIYRTGGWVDFGRLFTTPDNQIDCEHGATEIFIPIPGETRFGPFDRPEARDEIRCHPSLTNLTGYPRQDRPMAEWWPHTSAGPGEIRYQLRVYNAAGNINKTDATKFTFFCSETDTDCKFNQSIVSVFVGYTTALRGGDAIGKKVTYVNRWGGSGSGCNSPSVDCIPVTLENVRMNLDYNGDGRAEEARYFHTECKTCTKTDYDISPIGKQWITWFYRYPHGM